MSKLTDAVEQYVAEQQERLDMLTSRISAHEGALAELARRVAALEPDGSNPEPEPNPEPKPTGQFQIIERSGTRNAHILAPDGHIVRGMGFNHANFWGGGWTASVAARWPTLKDAYIGSMKDIAATGANMVRITALADGVDIWDDRNKTRGTPGPDLWSIKGGALNVQLELIQAAFRAGLWPMLEMHNVTGSAPRSMFWEVVKYWETAAPLLRGFPIAINIVNEYNFDHPTEKYPNGNPKPDHEAWRDSYIEAIARLRAAGYTELIVIDSGRCTGQSPEPILRYGREVFESDSLRLTTFSVHLYSFWRNILAETGLAWPEGPWAIRDMFGRLAVETGLPLVIGEFGSSLSDQHPDIWYDTRAVVEEAERWGFSWLFWAWHDGHAWLNAVEDMADPLTLTAVGKYLADYLRNNAEPVFRDLIGQRYDNTDPT